MSILKLDGKPADRAQEFVELRNSYTNRFALLLKEFSEAAKDNPVATPPMDALIEQFDKRWQNDCEQGERQGLEMKRDAFRRRADELKAELERIRMYTGPFEPQVLELFGFRRWKDGSWNTQEICIEPDGDDWRVTVSHHMVGKHRMPWLINLMKALGLQTLTPYNEPERG